MLNNFAVLIETLSYVPDLFSVVNCSNFALVERDSSFVELLLQLLDLQPQVGRRPQVLLGVGKLGLQRFLLVKQVLDDLK